MYPTSSNPGFYPPDEVIPAQTSRNREAVLRLLEISDCPYKAIGKETQYCGIPSTTIFSDDFETSAGGWAVSALRHRHARPLGAWRPGRDELERHEAARHDGLRRQRPRDRPPRGRFRGRLRRRRRPDDDHVGADRADGWHELHAELLVLPRARDQQLNGRLPARQDRRVDDAQVFQELGGTENDNGVWASTTVAIPSTFNGQTVRIAVEAADASTASLVEAGIDNVSVKR